MTKFKEEILMPLSESDLYQHDSEFCRYQDNLRWSRFQTAAIIEGAVFYAIWGTQLGCLTKTILAIGGLILIVVISIISQFDERDYASHSKRIQELEKSSNYIFQQQKVRGVPMWFQKRIKGSNLMMLVWGILYLFNVFAVISAIIGKKF